MSCWSLITNKRQLSDGVREFRVDVHQPTEMTCNIDGLEVDLTAGPRRYHVEIECDETVFVQLFNIVMRDSKNAPDLFSASRYVEVTE